MYLDICLSDIPKDRIKTANNGKKYLKAFVNPRKAPDQDGFDCYIAVSVPLAERTEEGPTFIGRAQYNHGQQQAAAPAPAVQDDPDNDLPF